MHNQIQTMAEHQTVPPPWPPLHAQIVHFDGFAGMGIPHIAVMRSLCKLWNQGVYIGMLFTVSYEIDHYACQALQGILRAQDHHYLGEDVQQLKLDIIKKPLPKCITLSLAEMVPCAIPQWEQIFSLHMGAKHRVQPPQNSGEASRFRDYYVQPELPQGFFQHIQTPARTQDVQHFPDGSTWTSNPPGRSPPTVKAIYPKLLRDQLEKTISHSDKQSLQAFRITTADQKPAWAGVLQFGIWLGLGKTLLQHYQEQFPCGGSIDKRSGQPADYLPHVGQQFFEPCGTSRLCTNCENLTELMGRAWHLGCAEAALEKLINHGIQLTKQPGYPKVITLFTAGSPCNKISRGIWANVNINNKDHRQRRVGPHAAPSNAIWAWHEGIITHCRLQQLLGFSQPGLTFAFQNPHICTDNCTLVDNIASAHNFRV